jgi:hypothetical protein
MCEGTHTPILFTYTHTYILQTINTRSMAYFSLSAYSHHIVVSTTEKGYSIVPGVIPLTFFSWWKIQYGDRPRISLESWFLYFAYRVGSDAMGIRHSHTIDQGLIQCSELGTSPQLITDDDLVGLNYRLGGPDRRHFLIGEILPVQRLSRTPRLLSSMAGICVDQCGRKVFFFLT